MTHLKANRAGQATPARQPVSKRTNPCTPEAVLLDKQEAFERYMAFHKGRHRPPTGEPATAKAGAGGGGNPAGDNLRTQAVIHSGAATRPAYGRVRASEPTYGLIRRPFSKPAAMQEQQALKSAVVIPFPKRR
jgi:hypothetical protein